MPIFNTQLGRLNTEKPQEALKAMANHIRYIQEQLEYTLMNLDSSNVTEIEADKTTITTSTGSVFTGDSIALKGKNGEEFRAGVGDNGAFQFRLNGKDGSQIIYLTSNGELVITNRATLIVDGGSW